MKKMFGLAMVLTAVCAAVMLAGCGKKAEKKVLRMATEATFPPYEYFEKGKIVGIDADIVTEIAKTLGYETEIIDMKFDSVILAVQTGKCEIAASGITVTEERKKQINFTIPYVTATQVIIIPKNSPLKTPDSLKDKKIRIGVQQGTTGDLYVLGIVIDLPDASVIAALLAGKLDAVVCDGEPAKVHVEKHPELVILPVALTSEEYAFAIDKKNTQLLKDFNRELVKMHKSGRLQQILDKYLAPAKK